MDTQRNKVVTLLAYVCLLLFKRSGLMFELVSCRRGWFTLIFLILWTQKLLCWFDIKILVWLFWRIPLRFFNSLFRFLLFDLYFLCCSWYWWIYGGLNSFDNLKHLLIKLDPILLLIKRIKLLLLFHTRHWCLLPGWICKSWLSSLINQ